MIGRRAFVALTGGMALVATGRAAAQQSRRVPVVGVVVSNFPTVDIVGPNPASPLVRAFVHSLHDLGWVDGESVVLLRRSAEGQPQRAAVIFAELLERGVDCVFVGTDRWLQEAALTATRTVPMAMLFSVDPVASGTVKSLARPGGNLTGLTFSSGIEIQAKRLQLLADLSPNIKRVAFLATQEVLAQFESIPRPAGIVVEPLAVDVIGHYDNGFAIIRRNRPDALMVSGGVHLNKNRLIVEFASANRLPSIFPWRLGAEAGGLMSYGVSLPGVWQQAARMIDRLLRGSLPMELPIEQPTKFELVINMKTAAKLGLSMPSLVLARADEVIE